MTDKIFLCFVMYFYYCKMERSVLDAVFLYNEDRTYVMATVIKTLSFVDFLVSLQIMKLLFALLNFICL